MTCKHKTIIVRTTQLVRLAGGNIDDTVDHRQADPYGRCQDCEADVPLDKDNCPIPVSKAPIDSAEVLNVLAMLHDAFIGIFNPATHPHLEGDLAAAQELLNKHAEHLP